MKNEGGLRLKDFHKRNTPGKPLISIITIVYNDEKHLERAIQSVLDQSYDNLEYIIIDGKSTDGTLDVIKKYEDRIDYWVSEPDQGISDAMNKGIRLSSGDIIAHLHADDYYADASVISSVQNVFSDNQGAMWLTGGIYIVSELGDPLMEIKVREYSYPKLIKGNIILHPSTFIRRNAFEKVGLFDPSLKYAMDYDLWIRLGGISNPITLDKTLTCFRAYSGSLSFSACDDAFIEEWQIRKKFLKKSHFKILTHYLLFHIKKYENRKFYERLLSK